MAVVAGNPSQTSPTSTSGKLVVTGSTPLATVPGQSGRLLVLGNRFLLAGNTSENAALTVGQLFPTGLD